MKVKLSSDDRCAIDLVLESRAEGNGSIEACFGKSSAALPQRVGAVETILGTLAQMPVSEPPSNLVAKTLKFIKKHEHDATITPAAIRRPAVMHGVYYRPLQ